jgi:hypothetical protein
MIPSTVVFVASDAYDIFFQHSLSNPDSCMLFDRWRRMRESGIIVHFQRILRVTSGLPYFKDFVFNLSGFEEVSVIGRNDEVSSQMYRRRIDVALTTPIRKNASTLLKSKDLRVFSVITVRPLPASKYVDIRETCQKRPL